MLSRLSPADLVVAGQRMARAEQRQRRRALLPSAPGAHADTSQGQGYRGPQRVAAADCSGREPPWSASDSAGPDAQASTQPAFPFRVEHIAEAYRATDPIQPRPGLYLHVRA